MFKSTLIYYSFSKMHINSMALQRLQVNNCHSGILFPKCNRHRFLDTVSPPTKTKDAAADSGEFVTNTEVATKDCAMLDLNIITSAAQTVLSLVLSHPDISDNLKCAGAHPHHTPRSCLLPRQRTRQHAQRR